MPKRKNTPNDLDTKIEDVLRRFAGELVDLVRGQALGAAQAFLQEIAGPDEHRAPARSARALGGRSAKPLKKGQKRTPAQLAATVQRVLSHIKRHPSQGQTAEELRDGLKLKTKDLVLPLTKLLDDGSITKKGARRGTRYYAK